MANKKKTLWKRPRWTRSWTQIMGVSLVILGGLQANIGLFSRFLTEETVGFIASGIGFVVFILRAYTTTSLGEKEYLACGDRRDDNEDRKGWQESD